MMMINGGNTRHHTLCDNLAISTTLWGTELQTDRYNILRSAYWHLELTNC